MQLSVLQADTSSTPGADDTPTQHNENDPPIAKKQTITKDGQNYGDQKKIMRQSYHKAANKQF